MQKLHQRDLSKGFGEVYLPFALERKYPHAGREWRWQYVFPSKTISTDPRSGARRRHHADEKLVQQFSEALDEDLNISGAWGVVFEWVRDTNRRIAENTLKIADAAAALAAFEKIDSVLGIGAKAESEAPAEITALAEARTAAKKAKDFKRADAIREELKAKGWAIEDTAKGPKLKKI